MRRACGLGAVVRAGSAAWVTRGAHGAKGRVCRARARQGRRLACGAQLSRNCRATSPLAARAAPRRAAPSEKLEFNSLDVPLLCFGVCVSAAYAWTKWWLLANVLAVCFSVCAVEMLSLGSFQIGCILLVRPPQPEPRRRPVPPDPGQRRRRARTGVAGGRVLTAVRTSAATCGRRRMPPPLSAALTRPLPCMCRFRAVPASRVPAQVFLFGYDIFWVFGTEVMVTVAKGIDAPIKLLFPKQLGAAKMEYSLLGLGDIVIPGIFVAMMLRFDARRQLRSLPYFRANMAAYVLALVTTVSVMHFFEAAQPALLYLVPGCLGAAFATATARGELGLLWRFSEEEDAVTGVGATIKEEAKKGQ